jgi:hypothetical protein
MVNRELRDYDRALLLLSRAEETSLKIGDLLEVVQCQNLKGEIEGARAQFGKAMSHYLDARGHIHRLEHNEIFSPDQLRVLRTTTDTKIRELAERMGDDAFQKALDTHKSKTAGHLSAR